jgi:hypothetical protein
MADRAITTGADRVVDILRLAGGAAPRADVLATLAPQLGRRAAGQAIGEAIIAQRVRRVLLPSGRIGIGLGIPLAEAAR